MKNSSLLLALIVFLVGCGGGGSSSNSAGSPPINNAPTITINTVDFVNEGETFQIDASASSDPDAGDTLMFSLSQTAGPAVVSDTTSNGIFEVNTPRVPIDEILVFEVTVTDGQTTTRESVSLVLRNIPSEPRFRLISAPTAEQ